MVRVPKAGCPIHGVVGVLTRAPRGSELEAGVDALELRADLLSQPREALEALPHLAGRVPVIFTLRLPDQGGRFQGNERERVELYREALRRGADLVDAELGSEAASQLSRAGAPLLVSHHDFESTPTAAELERLSREMEAYGPRAVKLVPTANSVRDAVRMLEWVEGQPGERSCPRVGFAMGERGIPSRVLSIAWGAPFTYGALEARVAPGQLTVGDLSLVYRVKALGRNSRVFGVIGRSPACSVQSRFYSIAMAARGLDTVFLPFGLETIEELEPCWLPLEINGLSVGPPLQAEARRRADEVDSRAALSGTVSTFLVERSVSGVRLRGYNTDFEAILEPLRRRLGSLEGLAAAVVGEGDAARCAVLALKEAQACPTLYYSCATLKGEATAELGVAAAPAAELHGDDHRVVINAAEDGGDTSPVAESVFTPQTIAFDLSGEARQSAFLRAAVRRGADCIQRHEALVAQATVELRLLTGHELEAHQLEDALLAAEQETRAEF